MCELIDANINPDVIGVISYSCEDNIMIVYFPNQLLSKLGQTVWQAQISLGFRWKQTRLPGSFDGIAAGHNLLEVAH